MVEEREREKERARARGRARERNAPHDFADTAIKDRAENVGIKSFSNCRFKETKENRFAWILQISQIRW